MNNLFVVVGKQVIDNGQGGTEEDATIIGAFVNRKAAQSCLDNLEFGDELGEFTDASIENPRITVGLKEARIDFLEPNNEESIVIGLFE